MAAKDNDSPPNGSTNSNGMIAKSSARDSMSPLRQRPLGRASTRRSSLLSLSESVEDAIRSSTDDFLLPRAKNLGLETHGESSHWHSIPLGLALLPALGGLFHKNGTAVLTDLTLLGIAAVFLNWTVRLPWSAFTDGRTLCIPLLMNP